MPSTANGVSLQVKNLAIGSNSSSDGSGGFSWCSKVGKRRKWKGYADDGHHHRETSSALAAPRALVLPFPSSSWAHLAQRVKKKEKGSNSSVIPSSAVPFSQSKKCSQSSRRRRQTKVSVTHTHSQLLAEKKECCCFLFSLPAEKEAIASSAHNIMSNTFCTSPLYTHTQWAYLGKWVGQNELAAHYVNAVVAIAMVVAEAAASNRLFCHVFCCWSK